ncbi:hypothetical protein NQ315_014716 [Exocentrus adspersus]|uniref:Uncharacterized protein n=1 Tax=Exocentrus adspersus TaxID=1586481 RepID=A0AAV8VE17_9CUCU|nr:hypothetical protein NQ315_014716 [Exocentrus adspersus]
MVKGPKNVPIRSHIEIKGRMIDIKKTVKYLGVIIDWQGYFGPHVRYVCHKASDRATSLSRLLPNIGGPSCEKRRIVMAVIHSIILYAAPIWAGATAIKCYKNLLESTQRKGLLRYEGDRVRVELELGQRSSADSVVRVMIESQQNWNMVHNWVRAVLSRKESLDRVRGGR